ncbi:hypothetical protein [Spiroplasma endosymbiont of Polydrusus pterygomalis]|uniref:OTU domain-containing protein n=1 Tax=Spiroplasma endosymbiont of Polydrusus pterygomalis TaxID=3139327 RepID=UPI003CCAB84F
MKTKRKHVSIQKNKQLYNFKKNYQNDYHQFNANVIQKVENYNENSLVNNEIITNKNNNKIYDVPKDGNCLFWAIIVAYLESVKKEEKTFKKRYKELFGNIKNWKKIFNFSNFDFIKNNNLVLLFRNRVVNFMKKNNKDFTFFISENINDEYFEKMNKNGTWGGEPEIKAISDLLKTKIHVNKYENNKLLLSKTYSNSESSNNSYENEIKIIHINNNHYQAILMQEKFGDKNEVLNTKLTNSKKKLEHYTKSIPININVAQKVENYNQNNLINNLTSISTEYIKKINRENEIKNNKIEYLNKILQLKIQNVKQLNINVSYLSELIERQETIITNDGKYIDDLNNKVNQNEKIVEHLLQIIEKKDLIIQQKQKEIEKLTTQNFSKKKINIIEDIIINQSQKEVSQDSNFINDFLNKASKKSPEEFSKNKSSILFKDISSPEPITFDLSPGSMRLINNEEYINCNISIDDIIQNQPSTSTGIYHS